MERERNWLRIIYDLPILDILMILLTLAFIGVTIYLADRASKITEKLTEIHEVIVDGGV